MIESEPAEKRSDKAHDRLVAKIIDALQRRDADGAEAAVAQHLENVKQAILGNLARN